MRGTKFNIHVDPEDGLLVQGQEGYQLTWMDAKMGDWVVTPRRGKAVEINALWFNALELLAGWLRETGDEEAANRYAGHAQRAQRSFNERFWYNDGGYLYDVIDGPEGNDDSIRPNQVFAISLDHPVLAATAGRRCSTVVERELLTPVGLRSLSPNNPEYKKNYHGDLKTRDAAYHQGTVWAWLIGPFIDAWLKLHPNEPEKARDFLRAFPAHLDEAGIGTISEVFDAEAPHTPARLHRAGLECRGSVALLGKNIKMPETAEEIAQQPEVREALDQTEGKKVKAQTKDKVWFVTYALLVLGFGALLRPRFDMGAVRPEPDRPRPARPARRGHHHRPPRDFEMRQRSIRSGASAMPPRATPSIASSA